MVTLDMTAKKNVTLTVGFRKNATENLGSVVVVVRPDGGDRDAIKDALMVNSDKIVHNPVDSALRRNNVISLTVSVWRDVIVDILEVYVFKTALTTRMDQTVRIIVETVSTYMESNVIT